jgi:hypothetical protein
MSRKSCETVAKLKHFVTTVTNVTCYIQEDVKSVLHLRFPQLWLWTVLSEISDLLSGDRQPAFRRNMSHPSLGYLLLSGTFISLLLYPEEVNDKFLRKGG